MGKSQKKRSMRRHNPMRVPDSHLPKGLAAASSSSSKTAAILPIVQKMESADAAERKWACVAVSNLIQNDPATRRLLQGKNIVGSLITRLTDDEEEVVVEAAGALRNLCIDGGYDICGEMYNKNILAPLKTFVPKITATLAQYLAGPKSAPENAKGLIYEFAENVITILWCLSETSNKALAAVNEMALAPFLMSFLAAREKLAVAPVVAAAQCLYVLTDDNPPAVRAVCADHAYIACLLDVVRSDSSSKGKGKDVGATDERTITLRVLAGGILRNISPLPASVGIADLDNELLLPLLRPVISAVSLPNACAAVQAALEAEAAEAPQLEKLSIKPKGTPKSDHKTAAEAELERVEGALRTVRLALEVLTGVCATLPDLEPAVEGTDVADAAQDGFDDEEEDAQPAAAANPDVAMDEDAAPAGAPPGTSAASSLSPLLEPLLALAQPTALSYPPAPSPHAPTTSALGAVHVGALECLNNLLLALGAAPAPARTGGGDDAAGQAVWAGVWAALQGAGTEWAAQAQGQGADRRREVWEVGVGVLWGVGRLWKGVLVPEEGQVRTLMQLCDASTDDEVRVKCIGGLECLAQYPDSIDANRIISTYLLSVLPSSTGSSAASPEVVIQALSALIDIYSDEGMPYDVNFRTGGMLARLADSTEGVKRAVRAIDRRREGGRALRARAEETRENLGAFIEYRRGLGL